MPSPDQKIGNYVLLEKLGAGGIGEVWKARDRRLNRVVALKFIVTERPGSSGTRDLLREARAASALNHPNIITIFEVGESDQWTYLAMEYVQGETLRARMERGPVPQEEALEITRQVVAGLAAAHREGIVHRDLKPENIMIRADGLAKILDFGLAKVLPWAQTATATAGTDSGHVVGTFTYMSPEQARAQDLTPASDVFSLGIILHELLAGQHPFRGPTVMDTLNAILTKEPPPCPALDDVVQRALRKEAGQRFATAGELAEHMKRPSAPPASKVRHQPLWMKTIGGTLMAGVLLLAGWYLRPVSTGGPSIGSIAVMNLRVQEDDARASPLAQGLPEELSSALAKTGLRVAAQSMVQELSRGSDPRSAGGQLGVDAVLAGNVRSYGSKLRVHLELVHTRTGFQIWSETFTIEGEDLLASEQKTAAEIAIRLRAALK